MANNLTPEQIKRDDFLRRLAIEPGEGLRQWKRLNQGERLVVVTYMKFFYDLEFALHFMKEADRRQRPDLVITVTNLPDVTPASLSTRGFKFQRTIGRTQVWVHPTGNEVWLLPSPKAAPPAPVVPQPVRPHPDIEEVQLYVTEYSQRKDEMITKYRKLKAQKSRLSQQEFERLLAEWTDEYSQWADDLKETLDITIPSMNGQLTPQEQADKQKDIDRLKALHDDWPADVDLGGIF
jgi:hypothetical protein